MNIILETQKAVYAALVADLPLMGMVEDIYDYVPQGAEYPYITIGDCLASDNSSKGSKGYQLDLDINIYSRATGRKEALLIMEAVKMLLDGNELAIENYAHIDTGILSSQVSQNINSYQGILRLKIRARDL